MDDDPTLRQVPASLQLAAAYAWRIIVVATVAVGVVWLLGELWVVVLALVVSTLLARALDAPTRWLRARGLPDGIAAVTALLGFLALLALAGALIVPRIVDEVEELGPTLSTAVDDVEAWILDDSPFDISRAELEDLRQQLADVLGRQARASSDSIASGALAVVEGLLGLFLALFTTFFMLKDGSRFQEWSVGWVPSRRQAMARRVAARSWATLGGFLRGAAVLGVVEGVIIGLTMVLVGAELALPVALITFAAAFVPFVGAIVAGAVATLVALATAGFVPAIIVLVVAVVVQQLDNDLLSPLIYGRALALHPLVILFAVVSGGALFGIGGTLLAVPVTAVVLNAWSEVRAVRAEGSSDGTDPGSDPDSDSDPGSGAD